MKTNLKLLFLGIFLFLPPGIYYHLFPDNSGIISIISTISIATGAILLLCSFARREKYKISDVKNGKIFQIKTLYTTPWITRVGINFREGEKQYFISPIPEELENASCGEKYQKIKNKIVKIETST